MKKYAIPITTVKDGCLLKIFIDSCRKRQTGQRRKVSPFSLVFWLPLTLYIKLRTRLNWSLSIILIQLSYISLYSSLLYEYRFRTGSLTIDITLVKWFYKKLIAAVTWAERKKETDWRDVWQQHNKSYDGLENLTRNFIYYVDVFLFNRKSIYMAVFEIISMCAWQVLASNIFMLDYVD